MCTPSSHLPALVRLNQAEKDNEAFYLDATDFIYSPRDLQLFVFEFEAPTLSVQGSSYTGGEKLMGRKKLRRIKRNVGCIKEAVLSKHILVKLYSSLSPGNPLLLQ